MALLVEIVIDDDVFGKGAIGYLLGKMGFDFVAMFISSFFTVLLFF